MARNKSPLQIRLEYYPLRGLIALIRRLPLPFSERFCSAFLAGLMGILPKRRKIMYANLESSFPDLTEPQRRAIAQKSMHNLAKEIARIPRIPDWVNEGLDRRVVNEGAHHVHQALKEGKGVIAFTAHYGFWELMAVYMHHVFSHVWAVARPLDNPKLDGLITSLRTSNGVRMMSHHQILRQGLRVLKQNEILGILSDQNFYKGGIFVDFFGRPAATTPIVSMLARRTGCAVIPVHNVWEGDKLRVFYEAPLPLSTDPDPNVAMAEDTQRMTKVIEGWIRKDPGQWLWLHNRWKRTPEPGDVVYSS